MAEFLSPQPQFNEELTPEQASTLKTEKKLQDRQEVIKKVKGLRGIVGKIALSLLVPLAPIAAKDVQARITQPPENRADQLLYPDYTPQSAMNVDLLRVEHGITERQSNIDYDLSQTQTRAETSDDPTISNEDLAYSYVKYDQAIQHYRELQTSVEDFNNEILEYLSTADMPENLKVLAQNRINSIDVQMERLLRSPNFDSEGLVEELLRPAEVPLSDDEIAQREQQVKLHLDSVLSELNSLNILLDAFRELDPANSPFHENILEAIAGLEFAFATLITFLSFETYSRRANRNNLKRKNENIAEESLEPAAQTHNSSDLDTLLHYQQQEQTVPEEQAPAYPYSEPQQSAQNQ